MRTFMKMAAATLAGAVAGGSIAFAQMPSSPGRAVISIYRAPPGQQENLMKWLATKDRVAAAAGVPVEQIYVHTDGDSWDFLAINPATTPAQDDAMEAAAKRMGVPLGLRAGQELRKYVAVHTDTFVRGPMTAADYLAALQER